MGGGGAGAVTTTAGHVRGQRGGGCHGEDITGVVWAVENITAPRQQVPPPSKIRLFRGGRRSGAVRGLGWPEMPAWGRVTVYTVKSGPLPGVSQDQGSSGPTLGDKSSPVHGSSAWTEGPPRFVWRAEARRCQQPSEKAREARITRRLRCSARPENLMPCSSAVVTYWAILAPAGSRQQWVHR